MVPACGIERSSEIIGALRRSVIGVAQQRLSNADMLRVMYGQFGRNNLAKEARVERAAELAFCYAADDLSHFLAVSGLPVKLIQSALPATGGVERTTRRGR